MSSSFIISEIGSSPAPAWDLSRWCAVAAHSGANSIKAQLFRASSFPESEQASKLPLEFPRTRLAEFARAARAQGLQVGASVFDNEAADLVVRHCDFIKLAAREQSNHALYQHVLELAARHAMPIYRSVSDLKLAVYHPLITTLFVIPRYPASLLESFMGVTRAAWAFERRGLRWGFSSHSVTGLECIWAARLGASVIERHLSLSEQDSEAGHSSLPPEFSSLVKRINQHATQTR